MRLSSNLSGLIRYNSGLYSSRLFSQRTATFGHQLLRFKSTTHQSSRKKISQAQTQTQTNQVSKSPILSEAEPFKTKIQDLPEHIRKTIPGETEQSNSLISRLPTFPLRNTSTLLPRPGVPTAADTPLRSMMEILNTKKREELIYEAEPHKLYFLICGVMAFVFGLYGLTFTDWGFSTVWELYKEEDDIVKFLGRLGICSLITGIALSMVTLSFKLPTRLIRRIWYLPGPKEHIRFTTHPILPGSATPVYTIPLENLVRSHKSKVFTKNGIYGTLDKSTFFFLLKENGKRFGYWIVDRNGWFWGDGRVFDILFGKETLEEAQKGQSFNEKVEEMTDALKKERKKMQDQHGVFWQAKLGKEMMKNDLKRIVKVVSQGKDKKTLPKD